MAVAGSPTLDGPACIVRAGESVQIQSVFPTPAIGAFGRGVVSGPSGLFGVEFRSASPYRLANAPTDKPLRPPIRLK